ncbi:ATP-binding protein [Aestuariibius sp. 2305UL40-4]|uniref:ATP-binding protein n=1 Tax=Aestuariibius violaceus TaxID=3234132 RepID=UPI00348CDC94
MECPACQSETKPVGGRCRVCDTLLLEQCPRCDMRVDFEDRFCRRCGVRLHAEGEGGVVRAFESERKNVTILFADLTGSLELLAEDPEAATVLLESVLDPLAELTREFGGTVVQAMGDGVMAVFGAPHAQEDHAFRACNAGLAIQAHFAEAREGPDLSVRVGINSGVVVMKERGEGFEQQYTAFGRTAHVASRLEKMAEPGTVLISQAVLDLVGSDADVVPLGEGHVRGLEAPVGLFRLTGMAKRWRKSTDGAAVPLVGREAELARLLDLAGEAEGGAGRVVTLSGEPGVGKSRLIEEFTGRLDAGRWRVLPATGLSHRVPQAFSGIREALAPCVDDADPALAPHLPAIRALFRNAPDEAWDALEATARRKRIFAAVQAVLEMQAGKGPVLLLFDDLQWIDRDSADLVQQLDVSGLPVLMLCCFRKGYRFSGEAEEIALDCLEAAGSEDLLVAMIGSDPALAELRATLSERTGGNPFFLEEIVRALIASGVLVKDGDGWRQDRALEAGDLPARVQDVVAARIDRLAGREKRILTLAAVFGFRTGLPLLAPLAGRDAGRLEAILAALEEGDFLRLSGVGEDRQIAFKHPLTHDVAYSGLLKDERVQQHGRIFGLLKEVRGDGRKVAPEDLAHHAERSGQLAPARAYLREAGETAMSQSASQHAIGCFEHAIGLIGADDAEEAVQLRLILRNALLPVGRQGEIPNHLAEAERLARLIGDEARIAQVLSYLSHYHWLVGDWAAAIAAGRKALARGEALGDKGLVVTTRFILGLSLYATGAFREAVTDLEENCRLLREADADQRFGMYALPSVVSGGYLAWCLAELGRFDEAEDWALWAKEVGEAHGRPFDRVQGHLALGGVRALKGDPAAIPDLERARELCETTDVVLLLPRVLACLAYALSQDGRHGEAVPMARLSLERVTALKLAAMRSLCLRWAGQVMLRAGEDAEAIRIAAELEEVCDRSGEAANAAWARYVRGSALLRGGAAEEGPALLEAAETAARALGMGPLAERCRRQSGLTEPVGAVT